MANSSLFNLSIDGYGKKSALSFEILEGISGDDYLSVSFAAASGSVPKSLIGKKANFSFEFNGKKDFFNGIIASCSEEQSGTGVSRVNLNVQTMRYWMDREKKCAVYCNSDLETIIKKLLNSNASMSSYHEIDFKIQYNESDLDFLRRLLGEYNLFEYVKHSESGSNMVISGGGGFEETNLNFSRCRLEMRGNGNLFFGYGSSPLRPGATFNAFDETFIVCSALHTGNQEAAFGIKDKKDGYACQIAAASKRALNSFPRGKSKPQIPGVIVAKTEGFAGSYPSLDSEGRYIVRMPFDEESEDMSSSGPVHLAQNFAGENCGVHFPLRKDTPVLIAFENGDIDKPVALGALPIDNCKGPIASEDSHLNMLKTSSGIKICFDDSTKSLEIEAPMDISIKAGGRLVLQGKMVEIN
jgi:uncharacterized protein involved in type VI secretion and phage assembly